MKSTGLVGGGGCGCGDGNWVSGTVTERMKFVDCDKPQWASGIQNLIRE